MHLYINLRANLLNIIFEAQFEEIMVAQTQSQMGESSSSTPLSVDDIYTQVLGPKRHGHVRSLGFDATLTSVFGVTKKETNAALASKLKEAQEREDQMQQQIQQQQGQLQQQQDNYNNNNNNKWR